MNTIVLICLKTVKKFYPIHFRSNAWIISVCWRFFVLPSSNMALVCLYVRSWKTTLNELDQRYDTNEQPRHLDRKLKYDISHLIRESGSDAKGPIAFNKAML